MGGERPQPAWTIRSSGGRSSERRSARDQAHAFRRGTKLAPSRRASRRGGGASRTGPRTVGVYHASGQPRLGLTRKWPTEPHPRIYTLCVGQFFFLAIGDLDRSESFGAILRFDVLTSLLSIFMHRRNSVHVCVVRGPELGFLPCVLQVVEENTRERGSHARTVDANDHTPCYLCCLARDAFARSDIPWGV